VAANPQPSLGELIPLDPHHPHVMRLGPKDLAACRKNPLWEAHHGLVDRVVCRKCGALLRICLGNKPGHLWTQHGISVEGYKAKYAGARIFSYQYIADRCGYDAPELMKRDLERHLPSRQLAECRKDPAWEARNSVIDRVVCRKCGAMVRSPMHGKNGHLWSRHDKLSTQIRKYGDV